MRRGARFAIAFLAVALVASACGGGSTSTTPSAGGSAKASRPAVKVGSTNFSEQLILGELYAQILEANGYPVERKFNLGNREITEPALESGQIDAYAEYLATMLRFVDKNAQASTDPKATADLLQKALTPKKITLLDFAPAVDQNAFVVTKETADKFKLKKISDLQPVAGQLVLGAPAECPSRPFCLIGLSNTYGLKFKDFKPLDSGGPLTVSALDGKQIDVGLLFSSSATIGVKGYVTLEDDKHLQLSDNIAPVVRSELLDKDNGDLKKLLNGISAKLTTDELVALNKQLEVDKKDPKDIAKDWLKKQGLIK